MQENAYPQIEAIFSSAIEIINEDERVQYLQKVCGSNRELRERVERLVDAHAHAGGFLPLAATLPGTVFDSTSEKIGSYIGKYKLLEQIGEGGMGTVYMAVQHKPINRKVALKIIKPGMDSRRVLARFAVEQQTLALMDHEHIARVLDAGTSESGRPYFAMELIRGVWITDFCDSRKLNTRSRLELFVKVCRAVQHAHQKGIIHRDLKPSNVLVTLHDDIAVPKVIDFGIAKAMQQPLTEHSIHTGFSELIGTPMYMSPEQAEMNALDVDTRTDIYSLGVLLYELITGTTPFESGSLKGVGFDEMRRLIREQDPPRPSYRVSTLKADARSTLSGKRGVDERTLDRILRGELDWIVMKAMEKDRTRRYESVSAFLSDIHHYLNDEPVSACPPRILYRFGKLARRNRIAVAFSSLVVTGMLLGVVGLSVANRSLSQSRAATQNALDVARESFDLADARATQAKAAEDTADKARLQAEIDRQRAEEHFRMAVSAIERLLSRIGTDTLWDVPRALPLRKALLNDSKELFENFLRQRPTDPVVRHGVALAYLRIGDIFAGSDRTKMKEMYTPALKLLEEVSTEFPENLEMRLDLADAHSRFAWHLYSGRWDQVAHIYRAIELLESLLLEPSIVEQSLAMADAPLERLHRRATFQLSTGPVNIQVVTGKLAGMYELLGAWHAFANEWNRAYAMYEQAKECARRGNADLDAVSDIHFNLASMHVRVKDYPGSVMEFTSAVEALREGIRERPDTLWYRELCAQALSSRGDAHVNLGEFNEALADYRDAFEMYNEVYSSRQDNPSRNWLSSAQSVMLTGLQLPIPVEYRIDVLHGLLQHSPEPTKFRDMLGSFVAADTNHELAITQLSSLIEEFPRMAELHYWRANIYGINGNSHEATVDLSQAIALDPANTKIRGAFVTLLLNQESSTLALPQLEVLLKEVAANGAANKSTQNWWPFLSLKRPLDAEVAASVLGLINSTLPHDSEVLPSLILRYSLLLDIDELEHAGQTLEQIFQAPELDCRQLYTASSVAAQFKMAEPYARICNEMLTRSIASKSDAEMQRTVWICALTPDTIDDYSRAIELERAARANGSKLVAFTDSLGAILMRSGDYDNAKIELETALAATADSDIRRSTALYFLAMTEHHLGNAEAAQEQLKKAHHFSDSELMGIPAWQRRVAIELLRNEADKLIGSPVL